MSERNKLAYIELNRTAKRTRRQRSQKKQTDCVETVDDQNRYTEDEPKNQNEK